MDRSCFRHSNHTHPRGDVRLVSRDPLSLDSRIQTFEVFQGVPPSDIDLPPQSTVDLEERACLTYVAFSAFQETQKEKEAQVSGEPSGAACAAASTRVSLSESEEEALATLETIMELL